jgi:hypothetical protein
MSNEAVWCGQEDSNLHGLPRYHLKVVRLPIPPWPQADNTGRSVSSKQASGEQALRRDGTAEISTHAREMSGQSSRPRDWRIFLTSLRCFFPSIRRSLDALVGLVLTRNFGTMVACLISCTSRARASDLLASWVRNRSAKMISTPNFVSLEPASFSSRARTGSDKFGEPRTSNRSSTAVETLFTFCPPGPDERTKLSCSSASSIEIVCVIRIMRDHTRRCSGRRQLMVTPDPHVGGDQSKSGTTTNRR